MSVIVVSASGAALVGAKLKDDATALAVAEGVFGLTLPARFVGLSLRAITATLTTASSVGAPSLGVRRNAATEVLSTNVTIDAGALSSVTAAVAAVINAANATVAALDTWWIDCDVAGTGALGAFVELVFA